MNRYKPNRYKIIMKQVTHIHYEVDAWSFDEALEISHNWAEQHREEAEENQLLKIELIEPK